MLDSSSLSSDEDEDEEDENVESMLSVNEEDFFEEEEDEAPVKGEGGEIVMVPSEAGELPPVGAKVEQRLDWDRRLAHMRVHTALHLLSAVINSLKLDVQSPLDNSDSLFLIIMILQRQTLAILDVN